MHRIEPVWTCAQISSPSAPEPCLSPADVDDTWRPLGQSWSPNGFSHPRAWARIQWSADFLHYDAVLLGQGAHNQARQLNERTWELGDVCEVFLKAGDQAEYLELHVTPENQRLQLVFPFGGIERMRSGAVPLSDYCIDDPGWVDTRTRVESDFWSAHLRIPAPRLRLRRFGPQSVLHTAVCQYDYTSIPKPVFSSTAVLREPSFHRHAEWTPLTLMPAHPL